MKTNLFILIFLFGILRNSQSQITFQTTIKTGNGGNGFCALQTADGGYAVVGYTAGALGPDSDVLLYRLDANGDTLWTKTFGGAQDDAGWYFQQSSDGGFIIVGYTKNFGAGNEDILLMKTDSLGNVMWSKAIGGTANDRGNSIQQTSDGGYIIAGYTESFGVGGMDICLVKTDANGDTLWMKTYGGSGSDLGTSVQQTSDGGYIVTGTTTSFGSGSNDIFLIKTDLNGNVSWENVYGDASTDYGYSVQQTTDGGYVAAGFAASFGAGSDDFYLIKTDSGGSLTWSKTYGGSDIDRARSVQQTPDGGYVLTGWSYSFASGSGDAEVFLVKTDVNGDALWTNSIGGEYDDQARSAKMTADGGFIITGGTFSFGPGTYDLYLIKTDSYGFSLCSESKHLATVTTPSTQVVSMTSSISSPAFIITDFTPDEIDGADITYTCLENGINKIEAVHFSITPNPSSGNFNILFNEELVDGDVEILNALGEKIFTKKISWSSEMKIGLGNISPGLYFLRINNAIKKIIID